MTKVTGIALNVPHILFLPETLEGYRYWCGNNDCLQQMKQTPHSIFELAIAGEEEQISCIVCNAENKLDAFFWEIYTDDVGILPFYVCNEHLSEYRKKAILIKNVIYSVNCSICNKLINYQWRIIQTTLRGEIRWEEK